MKRSQFRAGLKAAVEQASKTRVIDAVQSTATQSRHRPGNNQRTRSAGANQDEAKVITAVRSTATQSRHRPGNVRICSAAANQDEAKENDSDSDVSSFTESEILFLNGSPKNNVAEQSEKWPQDVDESSQIKQQSTNVRTPLEGVDSNANILKPNETFKRRLFEDTINSNGNEAPFKDSIEKNTSAVLDKVESETSATIQTPLSADNHLSQSISEDQGTLSTTLSKNNAKSAFKKKDSETSALNENLDSSSSLDNHLHQQSGPLLQVGLGCIHVNNAASLKVSSDLSTRTPENQNDSNSSGNALRPDKTDLDMTLNKDNTSLEGDSTYDQETLSTKLSKNNAKPALKKNYSETLALNENFNSCSSQDNRLHQPSGLQLQVESNSMHVNDLPSLTGSSDLITRTQNQNDSNSSGNVSCPDMTDLGMTLNKANTSVDVDSTYGSNIYEFDLPVFEITTAGLVPVETAVVSSIESSLEEQAVDDFLENSEEMEVAIEPEIQINTLEDKESQTPETARGRVKDRNVQPAAPLKKVKNSSLWKVNDAKAKRHLGLAFTSKEGKQFPAKVMRASCGPSCKFKCDTRVTEEDRHYFKDRYYTKNENQTKKWLFILNFTESKAVRRSHEVDDEDNPEEPTTPKKKKQRSCHNEFFMELRSGQKVKVCKDMFKSTLVISDSIITTALKKRGSPEKRGKVGVKRIIPNEVISSIHNHIRKFPRVESHYCRKDTTYEYLEEMVDSVSNMHRLYLEWMDLQHNGKQKATLRQYTDQFNTLKIKIFKPRKDLCTQCVAYDNIPEEQRTPEVVECHENHLLHKDLAKALYMENRAAFLKNTSVVVASFDMEKTHLLPQCRAGDVYYSRKLSVNNFTIKEVCSTQGYCYVWDETIAKRGANEVASFLHSYLEQRSQDGVKTFYFWSDNCGPQNKNRYLFSMYMAAAAKFDIKIVHRYLMTGHTSNDADGMHSLIERKTCKMDLYVPEDWYTAIENVKKTGKKFIVNRVKTEDIKEYHDFVDKKTVWYKDENKSIVRWSEIVDISVSSEDPWKLYFKYHHGDEYTPVVIRKQTAGRPVNLKTLQHPCAYKEPPRVEVVKKKELLELCQSLIVPLNAHHFYESLKT